MLLPTLQQRLLKFFPRKILAKRGVLNFAESRAEYLINQFNADVRIGQALRPFGENVLKWKKRERFSKLHDYIYSLGNGRVFILYGLRRTGKTTLICLLIGEMKSADLARTTFVRVYAKNTLVQLNADLKKLEAMGCKFVFID